jgi:hypothetical protein
VLRKGGKEGFGKIGRGGLQKSIKLKEKYMD